jgi:hypothetical protein
VHVQPSTVGNHNIHNDTSLRHLQHAPGVARSENLLYVLRRHKLRCLATPRCTLLNGLTAPRETALRRVLVMER